MLEAVVGGGGEGSGFGRADGSGGHLSGGTRPSSESAHKGRLDSGNSGACLKALSCLCWSVHIVSDSLGNASRLATCRLGRF